MSDDLQDYDYDCRRCGTHVAAAAPAGVLPMPLCAMCRLPPDEREALAGAVREALAAMETEGGTDG